MKSGISCFCILMIAYLIIAGIAITLGYDITNERFIVFTALAATVSSVIDFLNAFKSRHEYTLNVIKEVQQVKPSIEISKLKLEKEYDISRNLFSDYMNQVFEKDELNKICNDELSEEERDLCCKKISSYKFDNTKLKELMKRVVSCKISKEVEMVDTEEDYTIVDMVIDKTQEKINQLEKVINVTVSISTFLVLMVMMYFDSLIKLFPKIDTNASLFGFFIIICSVIVKESKDSDLENIREITHEILDRRFSR